MKEILTLREEVLQLGLLTLLFIAK